MTILIIMIRVKMIRYLVKCRLHKKKRLYLDYSNVNLVTVKYNINENPIKLRNKLKLNCFVSEIIVRDIRSSSY